VKTIAIFYQGRKQGASRFADQLVQKLQNDGHQIRIIDISKEEAKESTSELTSDCDSSVLQDCDLILVLGGDGTIVHAARMSACIGVPIVGIDFGRVGFLTELAPDDVARDLDYYLDGDKSVWVDKRTMLHTVLEQDGKKEEFLALNDVVIARGTWPRGVQVRIWIDDYFYNTSYADGMLISTATGSTAYNMAVGGPLLHPQVQSMVLTPIAAHLASDRSLVVQPEAKIKLQIFTNSQTGVFSADGQLNREVQNGAFITVSKSEYVTRFLRRRPPTHFYQVINAKLRNESTTTADI
jgi:Predicted sugar kinase